MENIRGLLSMKNKDGSKLIDTIVSILENVEPGYEVKYKLLKASDYEVPENRFSVVIIAFSKGLNINKNILNQDEVWNLSPQSQKLVEYIPEGAYGIIRSYKLYLKWIIRLRERSIGIKV